MKKYFLVSLGLIVFSVLFFGNSVLALVGDNVSQTTIDIVPVDRVNKINIILPKADSSLKGNVELMADISNIKTEDKSIVLFWQASFEKTPEKVLDIAKVECEVGSKECLAVWKTDLDSVTNGLYTIWATTSNGLKSKPVIVTINNDNPIIIINPAIVNLGKAGDFAILSKTGITDANLSIITGNVGASPISGTAVLVTCAEVTGKIFSVDAAGPLPCRITNDTLLSTSISDMATAYIDAAGRAPNATELGTAGSIGGLTFAPGVYKWSTNVIIPTDITLSGDANSIWIFEIAGNLNIASGPSVSGGTKILLGGGAQAKNIFWQVGGGTGVTLGAYSTFNGNLLSQKQIIIQSGAVLNGRALAQTQVTLDANTITFPSATPIFDATRPEISLLGDSSMTLSYGSTFTDLGATASDDVDGNITSNISTVNPVDTNTPGTYIITYNVKDLAGNSATEVTRTVVVNNIPSGGGGGSSGGGHPTILPIATTSTITPVPTAGQVLGAEKFNFTLFLKEGSQGNEVTELQKFSNEAGYDCGTLDGLFGPKTKAGIVNFQKGNNLAGDGIIGPLTRAVLNK